jgi:hypothetical protein
MHGPKHRPFVVAFMAFVVGLAAFADAARSQAPLDPQSLVGEWSGAWNNKQLRGGNGQYHLRIDQVEGNKVFGQVTIIGREKAEFKISGTLDGNRLTFSSANPTVFVIEGNQMKGSSQGSVRANPMEIALTKTK